jgi:hypothetical protein
VSAVLLSVVVALVGGYVAGRAHGKSRHHAWVAEGFRIMARRTDARGLGEQPITELTASALDVSCAFGTHRRLNDSRTRP